jgi:hypothetical protein
VKLEKNVALVWVARAICQRKNFLTAAVEASCIIPACGTVVET